MKKLLFIAGVLFSLSASAQLPALDFQFTLNIANEDRIIGMSPTADKGWILHGVSAVDQNFRIITHSLIKINSIGNIEWRKDFANNNGLISNIYAKRNPNPVQAFDKSGYLFYYDNADYNSPALTKVDNSGNLVWSKSMNSSATGFVQDAQGNSLLLFTNSDPVGGFKTQASLGGTDYWLLKFDKNGNKIWDKVYGDSNNNNAVNLCNSVVGLEVVVTGDYGTLRIDASGAVTDSDGTHSATKDIVPFFTQTNSQSYISGDFALIARGGDQQPVFQDLTQYILVNQTTIQNSTTKTLSNTIKSAIPVNDGTVLVSTLDGIVLLDNNFNQLWNSTTYKGKSLCLNPDGSIMMYGDPDFSVTKLGLPKLAPRDNYVFFVPHSGGPITISDKVTTNTAADVNLDGTMDLVTHSSMSTQNCLDYCSNAYSDISGGLLSAGADFLQNKTYLFSERSDDTTTPFNNVVADFDNDGAMEFYRSSTMTNIAPTTLQKSSVQTSNLPNFITASGDSFSFMAWADLDNNGFPDAIVNKDAIYLQTSANVFQKLNSSSTFMANISAPLIADLNLDGYLDIIDGSTLYKNSNLTFTTTALTYIILDVADLNGDGLPDLLAYNGGNVFFKGLNTGNLAFTFTSLGVTLPVSPTYSNSNVDGNNTHRFHGDFNNDGKTDLIGTDAAGAHIYLNNGSGTFTSGGTDYYVPVTGVPQMTPADFDNDGDLDFAVSDDFQLVVYRNNALAVNTKPTAPTGLTSTASGNSFKLQWAAATDDTTPAASLTYNVSVKRDGAIYINPHSLSSGSRTLVNEGNAGWTKLYLINTLPVGNYTWTVQAIDKSLAGSAFATPLNFSVANNPTNITLSNGSIAENLATAIGTFTTTDPDAGETFTYSLVSGTGSTDNAMFQISGNAINPASPGLNFESKASYTIRIRSTDNHTGFFEKVFTITATNVNEAATSIALGNGGAVAENSPVSTVVGALSNNDPDAGQTFIYTLVSGTGADDNSSFNISGANVITKQIFDFESGKHSYAIRVQVDDQNGKTFAQALTVTISDANDAPTDIQLTGNTIQEAKPVQTLIGQLSATDADVGETFTFSLVPGFGDNVSFIISGNQLQSGSEFVRKTKSQYGIKINVNDSHNASFQKEFTITVLSKPTGTALGTPVLTFPPVFTSDQTEIHITGTLSGGTPPYSTTLSYSGVASETKILVPQDEDANTFDFTISKTLLDEFGLGFTVKVTDSDVVPAEKETDVKYIYNGYTAAGAEKIPIAAFGGTLKTYQIISIPYQLDDNNIQPIFETAFPGKTYKNDWRLLAYQGDQYVDYTEGLVKITQGRGYWFNARTAADIKLTAGNVAKVTMDQPFTLALNQGWNLIGNPYPFNADWDDITSASASVTLSGLYVYNQEKTSYDISNVLKEWSGGFIFADDPGTVTFPVTLHQTFGGRRIKNSNEITAHQLDKEEWYLPISIQQDETESGYGGVGMKPEALATKDRYDVLTAPRFESYTEFNSTHNEFLWPRFSGDVVSTASDYTWNFKFESNSTSGATIRWDNRSLGDNGASLILYDVATDMAVDMKQKSFYSFDPLGATHPFKILFSREGTVITPEKTSLGKAYPNPVYAGTTIPYKLNNEKDTYTVRITVSDMTGRVVRTISKADLKPGFYETPWDGTNYDGDAVANGVYFYKISVDSRDLPIIYRLILNK